MILGIWFTPIMLPIADALSLSKTLYLRSQYPKSPPSSSSLKVNNLNKGPFLLTAVSRDGILSLIFQQYEHQVAVKQRPIYLKGNSLRVFVYPVLISITGPIPEIPSMKLIQLFLQYKVLTNERLSPLQYSSDYKDSQLVEGYQHIEFYVIICYRCYSMFKKLKIHRNFIRFSLLQSSITRQAKEANKKLKDHYFKQKDPLQVLIQKELLFECFQLKCEKTQSYSLTTQDTELISEGIGYVEVNNVQLALQKCQEKVLSISSRIDPAKEKLIKTKQVLKQTAGTLREKYLGLKSEYRNIRAQLPPLGGLARQAKNRLGTFFKLF